MGFVKIHAPFDVLLSTAERIRMRLPIEVNPCQIRDLILRKIFSLVENRKQ